jgi:hypothetical protein
MQISRRSIRLIGVTFAALALVAITTVVPSLNARQRLGAADVIQAPSAEWIPLSYGQAVVRNNGAEEFSYTMHQSADGSTRRERNDAHQEIQIVNFASGRYYEFHHGYWADHPMRQQIRRRVTRESVTPLAATDPRVAAVALLPMGLSFYEFKMDEMNSVIFCPELNMLEVWSRRGSVQNVLEKVVTWITLGQPQVDFQPPQGVEVTLSNTPAGPGIVPLSQVPPDLLRTDRQ